MKSMEIGSKQKYAHKQFLRGCFSVYHFEVGRYIICFNVVVFSNFANNVKFEYFCLDTKSYNSVYIFFLFFEKEIQ